MSYTPDAAPRVTTNEVDQPTAAPQPKVVAATIGAGVGAAAAIVLIYLIESIGGIDLPEAVEGAITVLVGSGLSFLAGYVKRPTGIS